MSLPLKFSLNIFNCLILTPKTHDFQENLVFEVVKKVRETNQKLDKA